MSDFLCRKEEPQAFRDLALVLIKRGRKQDLQRALGLLTEVVQGDWDIRFTQIEVIALMVRFVHFKF